MRARRDAAERAYGVLLRAYPRDFRAAYGREMVLLSRDRRRDEPTRGVGGAVRLWAAMAWDVMRSAPALRLAALRTAWCGTTSGEELPMATATNTTKVAGVLAIVTGAFEVANALAEATAGGAGPRDAVSTAAVALVIVAGALLIASGAALLSRGARAAGVARAGAAGCLLLVGAAALLHPWMSIFARLLGIGLPAVLLLLVRTTRGQGPSMPVAA